MRSEQKALRPRKIVAIRTRHVEGHATMQYRHPMQRSKLYVTGPAALLERAHGAAVRKQDRRSAALVLRE
jgi:hypothetical protein